MSAEVLVGRDPRGPALQPLDKVAAAVLAGLVTYLVVTESLNWAPFLLGALVGFVTLLIRWPHGALLGLLVAGSIPRWFMKVSTWNAKPEHMVAAACGGILLFRIFARDHKWESFEKLDLLLLAFLAMNYVSSVAYSPDAASTLRWALLQTLAASPFFLIRQLVRTKEQLSVVMKWWLGVGASAALFGICCYLAHVAFGSSVGITTFFYLGFIPGVHGSLWEPNIFGNYCTCFAVMYLVYYLVGEHKNLWYMMGFGLTTVGLFLSLARQAWVCLILVGGMVLLLNLRPGTIQWKRLGFTVVGILLALVVALLAMRGLSDRFSTLSLGQADEDPTVLRRAALIALAVDDIKQHPLVGLGSSSFQLLYLGEDDSYQGVGEAWLGTFFFRILHDTGIIGTVLLGWFILNLGRRSWRVLVRRRPGDVALGALFAAALVMMISYQLTDASTLAFTWIHLGLMVTALRLSETAVVTSG